MLTHFYEIRLETFDLLVKYCAEPGDVISVLDGVDARVYISYAGKVIFSGMAKEARRVFGV